MGDIFTCNSTSISNYPGKIEIYEFKITVKNYQNLILDIPFYNTKKSPPILIDAHYDAFPGSPGADDNASGVAFLL